MSLIPRGTIVMGLIVAYEIKLSDDGGQISQVTIESWCLDYYTLKYKELHLDYKL